MKKRSVLLLLLLIILFNFPSRAEVKFYPQVGVNATFLTENLTGITYSSSAGWQAGFSVQFGKMIHFQPGIFYKNSRKNLVLTVTGTSDEVKANHLNIPVLIGVKILPLKVVVLRINAGPSFSYLLSVGENDLNLTKDDYKDTVWGLQAGLGLDVLFLSFEISYEFGLTNYFEYEILENIVSSKANILRVNLGVRF